MFVCLRNLNPPFIARACPEFLHMYDLDHIPVHQQQKQQQ